MAPSLNTSTCWKVELLLSCSMRSGEHLPWWCFTKRCCFKSSICSAYRSPFTQGLSLTSLLCEASSLKLRSRMKILSGENQTINELLFETFSRYCFEIGTLLSTLAFMLFQLGEEIKNAGVKSFWRNLVCALNILNSDFAFKFYHDFYRNPHHRKFCLFYHA